MIDANLTNEILINTLLPETEYEMIVVAIDEFGNSAKCEPIKETTKAEFMFTAEVLNLGTKFGNVVVTNNNMENKAGLSITGRSSASTGSNTLNTFIRWYKTVDLTNYNKLTFYAKKGANHGNIQVYIDEACKFSKSYSDAPTVWTKYEIDISYIKGIKTLVFVGGYTDNTGYTTSNTQYCDIRLCD